MPGWQRVRGQVSVHWLEVWSWASNICKVRCLPGARYAVRHMQDVKWCHICKVPPINSEFAIQGFNQCIAMLRIMSLLRMQGSTDAWYIKNLPAIMHAYITYHWLLPQNQLVNSWSFCSSYCWQIQHSGWRPPGPLGLKSSLYAKLSWMGLL